MALLKALTLFFGVAKAQHDSDTVLLVCAELLISSVFADFEFSICRMAMLFVQYSDGIHGARGLRVNRFALGFGLHG